jgi:hypothetical protein
VVPPLLEAVTRWSTEALGVAGLDDNTLDALLGHMAQRTEPTLLRSLRVSLAFAMSQARCAALLDAVMTLPHLEVLEVEGAPDALPDEAAAGYGLAQALFERTAGEASPRGPVRWIRAHRVDLI